MRTPGRVQRDLPSEAIVISAAQMNDPTFRTPFVETLVKFDAFTPEGAYRKAQKVGKEQIEIRNAIDPRYFTEMVFGVLRGTGKAKDIHQVHKHIRDDVMWSNALAPWRRSPLWLVLRVAMQAVFENQSRYVSKTQFFMLTIRTDALSVLQWKQDVVPSKFSWFISWPVSWSLQLRPLPRMTYFGVCN